MDQNTNFAKLPSGKWLVFCITVNFIIQELLVSFVSVSLVRGKSERIKRKFKTKKSSHILQSTSIFFDRAKVIIHKSRGEASLEEPDTIENVSVAYLKFINNLLT